MFFDRPAQPRMPTPEEALKGRAEQMPVAERHAVLDAPLDTAFDGKALAMFGMGCFWGAERKFWVLPGVVSTAVGYAAGYTLNPSYREVCSGQTGHNEVVRVVFDPERIGYSALLQVFFENHDPTQGMRQGGDVGTQYRSGIYTYGVEQADQAEAIATRFAARLQEAGRGTLSTEIMAAAPFYFAEDGHQQYLHKNPGGYCGMGGTGVSCPVGPQP
jgi:peptide-methionine (S)-S-oxide reductase